MSDLFGIRVMVIRPGDRLHPGGDKVYVLNLEAADRAAREFGSAMADATKTVMEADIAELVRRFRAFDDWAEAEDPR